MSAPTKLDLVLTYADAGFRVGLLHHPIDGKCSCGKGCGKDAAKHPRADVMGAGITRFTTNPPTITRRLEKVPDANVGIEAPEGFVFVDIDDLAAMQADGRVWPATLQERTGRGGLHLLYRSRVADIVNSVRLLPYLDVRGPGSYIVTTPSIHILGVGYGPWEPAFDLAAVADAPEWLEGLLAEKVAEKADGKDATTGTASFTFKRDATRLAKLDALLANNLRAAAAWEGKKPEFPSPSEADMSLGDHCVAAGFTDQECADALVARRREHGLDLKRRDYYARTIKKARAGMAAASRIQVSVPQADETKQAEGVGLAEDRPALDTTQKAAAYRVALRHQHELRVAPDGPIVYTGLRWENDQARALALAARAGRYTLDDAGDLLKQAAPGDADAAKLVKEMMRAAKSFEQGAAIREILKLAAIYLSINARDLDSDPYLFNTLAGTLDLRTRTLQPHDPQDFITQLSPVGFDRAADCPVWRAMLRDILSDRLIEYLQKVFGLCLSGDRGQKKLFFFYGRGDNGKSAVLAKLMALLGSYGRRAMADLLLSSNSDRHPAEVAALRGSRAVIAEELDRGRHWRSALMKQITGEPEVTSRLLYQNPMTFERRWKTIIMANYKPKVDDNSPAFWDRMVLIKFIHTIPASKRNPEFLNNPGTELAGVLNWALDGFEAFQAHGLGEPPEVTEAVETYRHEADTLTTFINEACYVAEGQSTLATPLWAAYKAWTEERGVERLSADSFRAEMANQGFPSKHMNRGTCYQGLTLRSDVRREVEQ